MKTTSGYIVDKVRFANLYCKANEMIYRYGIWLLNDGFTIDSIVQEAFLKLWEFRDTITSEGHALRFLKQTVRWECHAYFRSSVSKFHRRFTYLDPEDDHQAVLAVPEEVPEHDQITEAQLKVIIDMLPFVPSDKERKFLKHFYLEGLTRMQIAIRYNLSLNAVSIHLAEGISTLKTMILKPQQLLSSISAATKHGSDHIWLHDIDGLGHEQSQIYRMRTELKYEFRKIADYLSLPQAYVQREYVTAWKIAGKTAKRMVVWLDMLLALHNQLPFLLLKVSA